MTELEGGSVNAAQIECYCVNANTAIASRFAWTWLSCCTNVEAWIQHAVAKMFFTNVEALGNS